MKFQAEISGEKYELEIRRDGRHVIANVDGRKYEVDVSEPELGVFLINHNGAVHQIAVSTDRKSPSIFHTASRQHGEVQVKLIDPKRLRGVADSDGDVDGPAEITTAMPGKVVRVLVEVGAEVSKGDGIIVVEAMKMQNEIKAPKDGVVRSLRVTEGRTVAAGETLATIE